MDYLENKLNPYQTIQKFMPNIIDAFTEYYGKENKPLIENKFQNMLLICSLSPETKERCLKENNINDKEKYQKHFEYINKCHQLKKLIHKKYMDKLVDHFKSLFPKEELETYYQKGNLTGKMYLYLATRLEIMPAISLFSKENDEILKTSSSKSHQKNAIITGRIDFFKSQNIDLKDDYYSYMNHQNCLNLIPSKDIIDEILDYKEEMEILMYHEYYENLPEYIQNKKLIDKENFLNKNIFKPINLTYDNPYVTPNLKLINKKLVPYPLVNIVFNNYNEYIDKYIIHELNHVYELTLNDNLDYVIGWDSFKDPIISNKETKRPYRLFNEIINDLLAEEITALLHKNNIYMFYPKKEAKIKGGTNYDLVRFLVQDFYNIFKNDIIKSRQGNINYIFNICGEENFNELNNLINQFMEEDIFKLDQILIDVKRNKNNQGTQKYQHFILKKDQIIQNMLKYKTKNINRKELIL